MLSLNPFFATGALYAGVALLATVLLGAGHVPGAISVGGLIWLRTHLLTVGTITQVAFGAAPLLTARSVRGGAQPAGLTLAQWLLLNTGTVLLWIGIAGGSMWVAATGATLILAALGLLLWGLWRIARNAGAAAGVGAPFYQAAGWFFVVGIYLALGLLLNWPAPGGRLGTLEAHVHANMWGWVALLAAGALFDRFPALVRRPLAAPGLVRPTFWLLVAGNALLVLGPWGDWAWASTVGLGLFVAGVALMLAALVRTLRAGPGRRPAAAVQVLLSYGWMLLPGAFAPAFLFWPELLPIGRVKSATVEGLAYGWLLQMAAALLPAVLASRHQLQEPEWADSSSWSTLWCINLGLAVIWTANFLTGVPWTLLVLGYGLIALGWGQFLRRSWRALLTYSSSGYTG